ncbi:MAG: asparagine synthase (glutamine-hydrolyzing) [Alphaproteobacteria bacterium]
MCGIAGLVLSPGNSIGPGLLETLAGKLAHRGPDDKGFLNWTPGQPTLKPTRTPAALNNGGVAFVHRRLTILDLTTGGWQPMLSPDGRYAIVFNGEIYNYLELQTELSALGVTFHSRSDTEVLLQACIHWGTEALNRLTGMFAFALLDIRAQTLFLARDQFGIKPLFFTESPGKGFAFASEIGALLAMPWVGRDTNPQRLFEYLRFGHTDAGDQTMFAAVRSLPAAHYLRLDLANPRPVEPQPYWAIDPEQRTDLSFEAAAEDLRARFLQNVRLHLRSDVPIGVQLSGGIDSSAICAAARHIAPQSEHHAFSYIATPPAPNEEPWIDLVAKATHTQIHKTCPTPRELMRDLQALVSLQQEPFASTGMYAQYRVFALAAEHGVKVTLDGQGADEMFAGYPTFQAARLATLIKQGRMGQAAHLLRHLLGRQGLERPKGMLMRLASWLLPDAVQGAARRLAGEQVIPNWLDAGWFRDHGVDAATPRRPRGREAMHHLLIETLTRTSLPALLRFSDRNAMAHSVESRLPFLTPDFAQFVLSLPEPYLVAGNGTTKSVLRHAMRGLVPDAVLDRRDKVGFATPERSWLLAAADQVDAILATAEIAKVPALQAQQIRHTWSAIRRGTRPFEPALWRWLNVILWTNTFQSRTN